MNRIIPTQKQYTIQRIKLLLRNWRDQIQLNIRAHERYGDRYSRFYHIFGVISIILLSGSSSTLLSGSGNNTSPDTVETTTIKIIAAVINIIVIIIEGLSMHLDLGGQRAAHRNSIVSYDALSRFIDSVENTLSIDNNDTEDPKTILESIRKQFDETVKNSAYLPLRYRVNTLSNDIITDPKEARGYIYTGAGNVSTIISQIEKGYNRKQQRLNQSSSSKDLDPLCHTDDERMQKSTNTRRRHSIYVNSDSEESDGDDGNGDDGNGDDGNYKHEIENSKTDLVEDTNAINTSNTQLPLNTLEFDDQSQLCDSPTANKCKIREKIQQLQIESKVEQEKKQGIINMLRYQWQRVTAHTDNEESDIV